MNECFSSQIGTLSTALIMSVSGCCHQIEGDTSCQSVKQSSVPKPSVFQPKTNFWFTLLDLFLAMPENGISETWVFEKFWLQFWKKIHGFLPNLLKLPQKSIFMGKWDFWSTVSLFFFSFWKKWLCVCVTGFWQHILEVYEVSGPSGFCVPTTGFWITDIC